MPQPQTTDIKASPFLTSLMSKKLSAVHAVRGVFVSYASMQGVWLPLVGAGRLWCGASLMRRVSSLPLVWASCGPLARCSTTAFDTPAAMPTKVSYDTQPHDASVGGF